jgi:hypothetical protein
MVPLRASRPLWSSALAVKHVVLTRVTVTFERNKVCAPMSRLSLLTSGAISHSARSVYAPQSPGRLFLRRKHKRTVCTR